MAMENEVEQLGYAPPRPGVSVSSRAVWIGVILFFLPIIALLYANQEVTCPYCHNSNANAKGNCVLRQKTGYCREDYYPQHHNLSTCPWCHRKGKMTRLEAFLD